MVEVLVILLWNGNKGFCVWGLVLIGRLFWDFKLVESDWVEGVYVGGFVEFVYVFY